MTNEEMELLCDEMEAFLRAGGTFNYSEWATLDGNTKAALIVAKQRIRDEETLMLATALSSHEGFLKAKAQLDGGHAWIQYNLNRAVDLYVKGGNH
jgi:hypothetical protein